MNDIFTGASYHDQKTMHYFSSMIEALVEILIEKNILTEEDGVNIVAKGTLAMTKFDEKRQQEFDKIIEDITKEKKK